MSVHRMIAAVAAAVLVVAACAPNSQGGESADTTSPAPTTQAPAPTTTSTTQPATTTTEPPVVTLEYVEDERSVLAIVRDRDDTTRFAELAAALGQDDAFRQARGVTVLVPVDEAFAALGDGEFEALLADPTAIALLLSEHLAVGALSLAELVERGAFQNAMAQTLPVTDDAGTVTIGDATVVVPDLEADNGVVHLVDRVIPPAGTDG